MTDDELERRLGRQRIAGPGPSLRVRVLGAATGEALTVRLGTFDYAMAAVAAGLLVAVTLIDAPAPPPTMEASRQREITDVARALGGGPDAMRYAELVVSRRDEPPDPASMEGSW
jgi:hypothetical protein